MHAGSGDGVCAAAPGIGVRKCIQLEETHFKQSTERIAEITITKDGLTHNSTKSIPQRDKLPTPYSTDVKIAQFIASPSVF